MRNRQSNRPDRRVATAGTFDPALLSDLADRLRYTGDARHKLHPGDYGFEPPVNPRPSKSVCDDRRTLNLDEARALFRAGVRAGMVSRFAPGGTPKYVWAIDRDGEIYEAKTKPPDTCYHGYRLGEDEREMRLYLVAEWRERQR